MAHKADRIYYDNFISAADYSCQAADYLIECLCCYDVSNIKEMLTRMHVIEHAGDEKKHEMSAALARAFVTPIDREDLAELSQNIDDVTDKIEEILQRFYIDEVQSVTEDCITFAKKISKCCVLMKELLIELENFKKPHRLRQLIIDLSCAEEDCDEFYLESAHNAKKHGESPLDILTWRAIYSCMEDCADACESVADSIETIVMKNT